MLTLFVAWLFRGLLSFPNKEQLHSRPFILFVGLILMLSNSWENGLGTVWRTCVLRGLGDEQKRQRNTNLFTEKMHICGMSWRWEMGKRNPGNKFSRLKENRPNAIKIGSWGLASFV